MMEFIIPILTFIGGFYVKQFFDNRDLRRKILEPVFEEFEKKILKKCLTEYNWHKTKVADVLDVNRRTLFNKMKKYNLEEK